MAYASPNSKCSAKAIALVLPDLKGKLDGFAMRVPTLTGSIVDLTIKLNKETTIEEINQALKAGCNESLGYTDDKIVSSDVIGISQGSLVDGQSTMKMGTGPNALYKVVSWYDNEMSYVNQLVRTIKYFITL